VRRLLFAAVCTGVLSLAGVALPPRADPLPGWCSLPPAFGADPCGNPGQPAEPGTLSERNEIGAAVAEGAANDSAAGALFEMLGPDEGAPAEEELDSDAMISPGHQADFDAIAFNWALYLEPLGSAGSQSAALPELPLTAYAVGYTRPKKGVLAETRDYSFSPGRMLGGLGLVVLCAGLVFSAVVGLAAFMRRRGGRRPAA
jgi:hypothetical protein